MVTGLEVAVGLLIAWFARKAGRAGKRLDGVTDDAMDAGLDKLHKVVMAKLGGDSALRQLESEVAAIGEADARTHARVRRELEEAAEHDQVFAAYLKSVLDEVKLGDNGIVIGRDVRADNGGVTIVMTGGSGSVSLGERQDPSRPGGRSPRR